MCQLTKEKEKAIRAALAAKCAELTDVSVFSRRRFISSKQDFFAKLGKTVSQRTEVRFCQIDYLGFSDILGEGLDDCPPVLARYAIHVFFQFADLRADNTNSTDEFIAYCIELRCKINNWKEVVLNDKKHLVSTLIQVSDNVTDSDTLTDVTGHYAEFTVSVEVRE
jgi:hypothetical protein